MYIITGGAGFIGSNMVKALNGRGITDILVVDDLKNGEKFRNIADCDIADYLDRLDFLDRLRAGWQPEAKIEALIHEGACSATTEWDGEFIMANNYEYSKALLHWLPGPCRSFHLCVLRLGIWHGARVQKGTDP